MTTVNTPSIKIVTIIKIMLVALLTVAIFQGINGMRDEIDTLTATNAELRTALTKSGQQIQALNTKLQDTEQTLHLTQVALQLTHSKLQSTEYRLSTALIPESNMSEAVNNHVVQPTKQAVGNVAVSVKSTATAAYSGVRSSVGEAYTRVTGWLERQ